MNVVGHVAWLPWAQSDTDPVRREIDVGVEEAVRDLGGCPWAIGVERLANEPASPTLHTCHPTHSAFQCSTAVKIQPHPSSNVKTRTPAVPHITFGACVTIVPACTRAVPWRPRCGESSLCARITRSTRVRATRIPSKIRSRAWTFRWPSPWNGERSRSA